MLFTSECLEFFLNGTEKQDEQKKCDDILDLSFGIESQV